MGSFLAGAGSALFGGALSGISNLFGAHSQNQSVEKQLAAAREEAEKTRKWQTSEREAQNDWNYKLWQANNEYNTPAAVQCVCQILFYHQSTTAVVDDDHAIFHLCKSFFV